MPDKNQNSKLDQNKTNRHWKESNLYFTMSRLFHNKLAVTGMLIILSLIILTLLYPVICKYSYSLVDPFNAYQTPSAEHIFGTDTLGRDIFSRIVYGVRYSLSLGFVAEMLGLAIGIVFGCIAGYFGGMVDTIILRICDVIQSIPGILLCICISQVLGSGFFSTVLALCFTGIPQVVRLLRANILSVREQEFVEAAQAITCGNIRIMFKHILPNCIAPLIINSSNGIGGKIMTSASLSFLGLGVQEPLPEWGAMLSAGKNYFRYYPHLVIVPGIFIAITILAFNLIGDGLRDALDPKLRS
ncbi:MAG: ABC transporter permease [Lachnospiraceae bacterium]|nr:ABC transporter permease [Lachnospiraceae bacterium]